MPPRNAKVGRSNRRNQTLGSFFNINGSQPAPPPLQCTTRSQAAAPSQETDELSSPLSSLLSSPKSAVVILDSDSDDELLDPHDILGPATPGMAATPATPTTPATRPGLRPRASPITPAPTAYTLAYPQRPVATPYRNNLQSLVRAHESKRYDLGFLDEQMLRMSDSDDDGNSDTVDHTLLADHAVQSALPDLPKEDADRVRTQLGATVDSVRSPACLTLFVTTGQIHMAPAASSAVVDTADTTFKEGDPVERAFSTTNAATHGSTLRRILKSRWIIAQAHLGWKLTQNIGDMLLRAMCFDTDHCAAHSAWLTLQTCIELRLSSWELRLDTFLSLLSELQGKLCDRAYEGMTSSDCQSDSSSSSSPSIYVAIEVTRRPCVARASAERVAHLLDIAAHSLDLLSVEDICRVLTMFVASLLDHGNSLYRHRMQQSLVLLLDRVSPASKWALVWTDLVSELGRLLAHLQIQTLLGIVEQLPTSNKRCMQIRCSLSFMFLRMQSSNVPETSVSLESLARAATLPSQIALRVVSEMILGGERLFRVGAGTDFAQLEAAVGLLSNILDSVQAMHDVRDVTRAIYERLYAINQRINDGIADSIDKTLAKDAVQTLVVRLFMTATSDSATRLNPVYNSVNTLDSWLNVP